MQPLHARRSALMVSFVETCSREMKHLTNDKLIFDCGEIEDIQHLGLLFAVLSEGVNLDSWLTVWKVAAELCMNDAGNLMEVGCNS